ncbi:unnamed protein product [Ceratitis capitata]|uniref:(Mediterranean fruit fly) hypothetical protein n=1 Tax=Ceratitis capitata TaxID=7213 RepID=A0A811UY00_CERCA|nr:unnamed protein product [Ceratitis capitata]
MRDDLGFALPSKSYLLRWRPNRYVVPGLDANVLLNLSKVIDNMSDIQPIYVILFDEIIIKSDLVNNRVSDLLDGSINTHPSAHDIQYIVARLISMKILRKRFEKKVSNCEDDDNVNFHWDLNPEDSHLEDRELGNQQEQLILEDIEIPNENFESNSDDAEVQVKRYYTGYGIYQKIMCKLQCQKCTAIIAKTQSDTNSHSEALIRAKNFKGVNDLRLVNTDNRAHYSGVRRRMLSVFPEWLSPTEDILEHRIKLLEFVITVLLFKNAKWLLAKEKNNQKPIKNVAKMKKL